MRAILSRRRPGDGVLGEEYGQSGGTSGLTWVLDPIDGTRAFLSGTPSWGVLIALSDETGPRLGLIDQPYTGERFVGAPGIAEWTGPMGTRRLRSRATTEPGAAILFTTFPEIGSVEEHAAFARVARACRLTRYGLDCYAHALLAMGQIDLVIEAGLEAHDIHAPTAVIEAAGGIVSDWHGGPAHHGGRVLAAANPALACPRAGPAGRGALGAGTQDTSEGHATPRTGRAGAPKLPEPGHAHGLVQWAARDTRRPKRGIQDAVGHLDF